MSIELRDILYFDFEKAASLISQVDEGLSKERTEHDEKTEEQRNIRRYDLLKIFKAEFGGISEDKRSTIETKILHHDLLGRLEDFLFQSGFAVDVNQIGEKDNLRDTRNQFESSPYLRAEGWCAIEDFDRVYEITHKFNDILDFVKRSELENLTDKDKVLSRLKELDLAGESNSREFKELSTRRKNIDKEVKKAIDWERLPSELFQGIRDWIDTLARHRLNIRLIPFEKYREFQVIANLKRNCFVDEDLDHLLFGYGTQPNIRLSVFGLVTSVPSQHDNDTFDVYEEDDADIDAAEPENDDVANVERAFRALFPAIRGMEKFTSFHHYPRLVVHPIAVYRNIRNV